MPPKASGCHSQDKDTPKTVAPRLKTLPQDKDTQRRKKLGAVLTTQESAAQTATKTAALCSYKDWFRQLGYKLITILSLRHHANHVTLRKREQKGCKKGRKKGVQSGGFTVALFLAHFALTLLLYLVNFIAKKFISSLLDPFYTTELKRGKKPGEKRKEWEKGRKKGAKKGGKRATVNDPIAQDPAASRIRFDFKWSRLQALQVPIRQWKTRLPVQVESKQTDVKPQNRIQVAARCLNDENQSNQVSSVRVLHEVPHSHSNFFNSKWCTSPTSQVFKSPQDVEMTRISQIKSHSPPTRGRNLSFDTHIHTVHRKWSRLAIDIPAGASAGRHSEVAPLWTYSVIGWPPAFSRVGPAGTSTYPPERLQLDPTAVVTSRRANSGRLGTISPIFLVPAPPVGPLPVPWEKLAAV
ncbi:hypothetical protein B0H16DRAFT_1470136 [Mycena metata]|uniref:Uncharacterized protein n=1 Tax=Mycena metata TaxID=1033252 RepID=A0AAD7HX87_9AGAR|nr:hypothetical protein B0H16DRAFT_1470136 [Mycena metata]